MALFNQKDETPAAQPMTNQTQASAKAQNQNSGQTVFGATLIVEGTIHSKESITVNGELKGTVETTEHITIGKDAKIEAALTGKTILIAGAVTGNSTATENITLESSAVVKGDVKAGSIQIQTGAVIDGNVHIGKTTAASQPAPGNTEKSIA